MNYLTVESLWLSCRTSGCKGPRFDSSWLSINTSLSNACDRIRKKKTFLMRLSKVNKQREIYTFLWFRRYRTLQQLIGLETPEELSVSFIRWLQKFLKGRVLSYCLTCLFACLPTHLFAYTDDRVMLSSFITGQSPQIIKIKNHMIFVPTSCSNVFFLIRCVFFLLFSFY